MFSQLAAPIAVVAHDAGAANHLLAWLGKDTPVQASFHGPALALWQRSGRAGGQLTVEQALHGCRTLVTGTGWATDIEHEARRRARELGIHSIAVIDHWTNYRARFERAGELVLPDEIWVSDRHALDLARAAFPGLPVRQQPNAYLAGLAAAIAPCPQAPHLLYVLEPIRDAWGTADGEFAALDYFAAQLRRNDPGPDAVIRLRPHPSDPPGKYGHWIARQHDSRIGLDPAAGLDESLSWARTVVGCQTYAMVVALAAGRRVLCSIPPWAPPCVLPYPEIVPLFGVSFFAGSGDNIQDQSRIMDLP